VADSGQARSSGCVKFRRKLRLVDMSGRFGKQQDGTLFQRDGGSVEEGTRSRHLMHHGTGEHEVNRVLNIVEAHRCWRNHAGFDAIE
jgi:hypothetical protein